MYLNVKRAKKPDIKGKKCLVLQTGGMTEKGVRKGNLLPLITRER